MRRSAERLPLEPLVREGATDRGTAALSAHLARLSDLAAKRAAIAAEEAETLAEMARIGGMSLAGSAPESVSAVVTDLADHQGAAGAAASAPADAPEPRVYLTQTALAEVLDTHPRTIRRMELAGELPAPVQLGRLKRWRRSEIQAWLEQGRPKPRRTRR